MIRHLGYKIDPSAGVVYGLRGQPIRKIGGRYVQVTRRGFRRYAHVMVWECANGPIPAGMQVNHINGVRTDNRLVNLELVTPSENTAHAYRAGLRRADGENNGRAKLTANQAACIFTARGKSNTELANDFGVSRQTIRDIRQGRKWASVTARCRA